jgi:hypothetical protein
MLDSRPRIDLSTMLVYIPISWNDESVNCVISSQNICAIVTFHHFDGHATLTKEVFYSYLPVRDWGIHLEKGYKEYVS